ncbi:DNA repair protein SWI5 homolog [Paramisgurnus dabryanus]|uniref:DNA repair protein SWI5 homolog n=1 Tax=Paramisgurnus dabryanus TaxID=90735 RepID=UPI0031F3B4D2
MEASAEEPTTVLVDDPCVKLTPRQGGVSLRKRSSDSTYRGRNVYSGFKSPAQNSSRLKCAVRPEEEAKELRQTLDLLDSEIAQLEKAGFVEKELDQHIDLLHEYNDIKDIGQTLLGRLAGSRGLTTRDLYSHFGLELDD